jgi:signal transduction histidine kinase
VPALKCLLVDDTEANLVALEAILEGDDCEIHKALSGRDALDLLIDHDFALALIDVRMPEMDGFELAELMRGTERTRSIPIIFISAETPSVTRTFKGYDSGAVDFLYKPLDPHVVRSKVRVFLQLKSQMMELQEALEQAERARAEAEEANQARDQFLALVSHELRNPLSSILAGADFLKRVAAEDAQVQRTADIIDRNARLQARLVGDLLDLSRITRNRFQLQQAPISLDAVVRDALQSQIMDAQLAKIEIRSQIEPEVRVYGDADRLQQVVTNLLSNAIKFTPPGGEIAVMLERHSGVARITVQDSGIGIEPGRADRLFEIFHQGEIRARRQGLGIGLALVKSLAELHKGRVWAESEGSGKGARFCVEIPVLTEPPMEPPPPRREEASNIRLLIVEDNDDTRTLLAENLRAYGHQVLAVASAEEALEVLDHTPADLVLCDIGLPKMDGYEFLKHLRRSCPENKTPAFAITALGEEGDVRRSREAGFVGHFVKPVNTSVIDQRIRDILARETQRRPE